MFQQLYEEYCAQTAGHQLINEARFNQLINQGFIPIKKRIDYVQRGGDADMMATMRNSVLQSQPSPTSTGTFMKFDRLIEPGRYIHCSITFHEFYCDL